MNFKIEMTIYDKNDLGLSKDSLKNSIDFEINKNLRYRDPKTIEHIQKLAKEHYLHMLGLFERLERDEKK